MQLNNINWSDVNANAQRNAKRNQSITDIRALAHVLECDVNVTERAIDMVQQWTIEQLSLQIRDNLKRDTILSYCANYATDDGSTGSFANQLLSNTGEQLFDILIVSDDDPIETISIITKAPESVVTKCIHASVERSLAALGIELNRLQDQEEELFNTDEEEEVSVVSQSQDDLDQLFGEPLPPIEKRQKVQSENLNSSTETMASNMQPDEPDSNRKGDYLDNRSNRSSDDSLKYLYGSDENSRNNQLSAQVPRSPSTSRILTSSSEDNQKKLQQDLPNNQYEIQEENKDSMGQTISNFRAESEGRSNSEQNNTRDSDKATSKMQFLSDKESNSDKKPNKKVKKSRIDSSRDNTLRSDKSPNAFSARNIAIIALTFLVIALLVGPKITGRSPSAMLGLDSINNVVKGTAPDSSESNSESTSESTFQGGKDVVVEGADAETIDQDDPLGTELDVFAGEARKIRREEKAKFYEENPELAPKPVAMLPHDEITKLDLTPLVEIPSTTWQNSPFQLQ